MKFRRRKQPAHSSIRAAARAVRSARCTSDRSNSDKRERSTTLERRTCRTLPRRPNRNLGQRLRSRSRTERRPGTSAQRNSTALEVSSNARCRSRPRCSHRASSSADRTPHTSLRWHRGSPRRPRRSRNGMSHRRTMTHRTSKRPGLSCISSRRTDRFCWDTDSGCTTPRCCTPRIVRDLARCNRYPAHRIRNRTSHRRTRSKCTPILRGSRRSIQLPASWWDLRQHRRNCSR